MSQEEWFKMWSDCTEAILTKQEFPFWLSAYMGFMFDAADTSGEPLSLSLSAISCRISNRPYSLYWACGCNPKVS